MGEARHGSRWKDIQRRINSATRKEYPCWYGRMKDSSSGRWKWHKLYTDKRASQRKWDEMVTQAEHRAAGVRTPQMDAAGKPVPEHVKDYFASLRASGVVVDHLTIATQMLNRLVSMGGWKRLGDITEQSLLGILARLEAEGKSASYRNKYISRAKAFVHWCMPDRLANDPLVKVKRINLARAKKKRARRAGTNDEIARLMAATPAGRRLQYAFGFLTGLRRSELASLRWGDLRLDEPIPYLQLREETTKNSKADRLPLHSAIVGLLRERQGESDSPVVSRVPDPKTIRKDLIKAKVEFTVDGRRLDFHALRHTFASNLDSTGASFSTKKALMRHADSDITEGYSHARMVELHRAIERLPTPEAIAPKVNANGTQTGQTTFSSLPARSLEEVASAGGLGLLSLGEFGAFSDIFSVFPAASRLHLPDSDNPVIVQEIGPDTQVD